VLVSRIAEGQDLPRPRLQRTAHDELQLPYLVAAVDLAEQIVPLDVELTRAEDVAQYVQLANRRRELAERSAGKLASQQRIVLKQGDHRRFRAHCSTLAAPPDFTSVRILAMLVMTVCFRSR